MARVPVNKNIEAEVLSACKRRCAICVAIHNDHSVKRGQIAHLDRDNTNSSLENLVFLCTDHHDIYDSRTSQTKNYTPLEVKGYRNIVNAIYASKFTTEEKEFIRNYLNIFSNILNFLAESDDQLAVEIDVNAYEALQNFINSMSSIEVTCFNQEMKSTLTNLHTSVKNIWNIISDFNYIRSGWRIKFDNTHRNDRDVQAVLWKKRLEITPHLNDLASYFLLIQKMAI